MGCEMGCVSEFKGVWQETDKLEVKRWKEIV